jgi:hypothetical protein
MQIGRRQVEHPHNSGCIVLAELRIAGVINMSARPRVASRSARPGVATGVTTVGNSGNGARCPLDGQDHHRNPAQFPGSCGAASLGS